MNKDIVRSAVSDFANSGDDEYDETFSKNGELFRVRIERLSARSHSNENLLEKANTISALPSGSPCACCGGSGRSR
jgi:hypothetical protein